jgi:CDP-2,3-bis-(O-geranylgeranyl)-sn-glycerol synthase
MDCRRKFHGKRLFGPNKTWRGFVSGVVMATCTLWLQQVAVAHIIQLRTLVSPIDYATLPVLILGPLFGTGALGGDALESLIKRQRGIPAGKGWIPFDQLDYIVGGIIAIAPIIVLNLPQYIWLLIVWVCIHLAATAIGYALGFRTKPI